MIDNNGVFDPLNRNKQFTEIDPLKSLKGADELGLVTNPICRRFFTIFRVTGTLVMVFSLLTDYTYAFKQTFSSKELFAGYMGLLAFRSLLPFLIAAIFISKKVCNKERNALPDTAYSDNDTDESI